MKQYKVTLEFTFRGHSFDGGYGDDEEELAKKEEAFATTDAYYETHSIIDHIKSNSAFGFVEWVLSEGEVVSAEWDKKDFKIHMIVESNATEDELREDLEMTSLEDGEYEACGDTGWVLTTRSATGELPTMKEEFWEYGLTDYRNNPIEINEIV